MTHVGVVGWYRKIPVAIQAIQWLGHENTKEVREFCGDAIKYEIDDHVWEAGAGTPTEILTIHTLEGDMEVSLNDYVIKGVNGEFYPCKPDIFEKTYEEDYDEDSYGNDIINRNIADVFDGLA